MQWITYSHVVDETSESFDVVILGEGYHCCDICAGGFHIVDGEWECVQITLCESLQHGVVDWVVGKTANVVVVVVADDLCIILHDLASHENAKLVLVDLKE